MYLISINEFWCTEIFSEIKECHEICTKFSLLHVFQVLRQSCVSKSCYQTELLIIPTLFSMFRSYVNGPTHELPSCLLFVSEMQRFCDTENCLLLEWVFRLDLISVSNWNQSEYKFERLLLSNKIWRQQNLSLSLSLSKFIDKKAKWNFLNPLFRLYMLNCGIVWFAITN